MKTKTTWYIEPIGQVANQSLFELLGETAIQSDIACSDGSKHDLFTARSYDDVRRYVGSSMTCNFWKKVGKASLPVPWHPPKKKKDKTSTQSK
jgi:hypothetical protein